MIQCETISLRGADDLSKFDRFHAVLAQLFPLIHEKLEKTEIDGSLLFRWPGKSHDHAVLLMSHQDVVEATGEWKYPPFAGKIAEGRIWGRGTMDTKGSLCAILEAVEELLRENFTPSCDVYVASSCNEEIMGDGAPKTAEYSQAHGVKLDLVLDEGGAIVHAPMPGLTGHYAMLGILEKGYADVRFVARAEGGIPAPRRKTLPLPASPRLSIIWKCIRPSGKNSRRRSGGCSARWQQICAFPSGCCSATCGCLSRC